MVGNGVRRILCAAWLAVGLVSAQGNGGEFDGAIRQTLEYERDYDKALQLLEAQRAKLRERFTDRHPMVIVLDARIADVRRLKEGGEGAPQDPTSRPSTAPNSFNRRAWDLAEAAANDAANRQSEDLTSYHEARAAMLGAPIVPSLAKLLDGDPLIGQNGAQRVIPPRIVAQLITAIDDPAADAVVEGAMRSTDPVIQQAMAESLSLVRHRKLVDAAITSSNKAVRGSALVVLTGAKNDDAAAAAALTSAVREGFTRTAYWLVTNRRSEALAMLRDKSVPVDSRSHLARVFGEGKPPPLAEEIMALLSASNDGGPWLDDVIIKFMTSALGKPAAKVELMKIRTEAEAWLLARIGKAALIGDTDTIKLWEGLATTASLPKLEELHNAGSFVDSRFSSSPIEPGSMLRQVRSSIEVQLKPEDRPMLVALLATVDDRMFEDPQPDYRVMTSAVLPFLQKELDGCSAQAALEIVKSLSGSRRAWLLETYLSKHAKRPPNNGSLAPATVELVSMMLTSVDVVTDPNARVTSAGSASVGGVVTNQNVTRSHNFRQVQAVQVSLGLVRSHFVDAGDPQAPAFFDTLLKFSERQGPNSDLTHHAIQTFSLNSRWSFRGTILGLLKPVIEKATDDSSGNQRLKYLKGLSSGDLIPLVKALLAQPRSEERTVALLEHVLESGDAESCAILAAEWTEKNGLPTPELMHRAVKTFENKLYLPALPLLRIALTDGNFSVREAAQTAFKTFKENREALEELDQWKRGDAEKSDAVAELTALLDHQKVDVVIGAVRSLGALKAKAVLPKLVRLLERDEPELKTAVNEAIAKIGT